ncbi:MAG: glycosyltransferase family 4 protein [Peptoniphilaceae bacterium]|nr:glycosyltransferase family 4 protein [Peptoniphilaceae bacterium]MDY3076169.1 glycosyltransferase family 4 protein [Peptoniphilaceae bacterium]
MNILYIDHYAGSTSMGMEFRPFYMAKEWLKRGHNVRILAGTYSHLRQKNPKIDQDLKITKVDGVDFQWLRTRQYHGNGVARALSMMDFCSKIYRYRKRIVCTFRPDLIITSSTYPMDTWPAQSMRKLCPEALLIHEAHDLWPQTLIDVGGLSERNPLIRLIGRAEKSAFYQSDGIVTVLSDVKKYVAEKKYHVADKMCWISNGIWNEDWARNIVLPDELKEKFSSLKSKAPYLVGYLGGHAISNALDLILDAAALLKDDKRFYFVLIGDGIEKKRLLARIQNEKMKNIEMLPSVRKEYVPNVLQYMDVLYLGLKQIKLLQYGVSMNKLYDYMMAEKPIIYGASAPVDEVRLAQCGYSVAPGSSKAIEEALLHIADEDPMRLRQLGENGRRWVLQNRSYQVLAEQFLQFVEEIKEKKNGIH